MRRDVDGWQCRLDRWGEFVQQRWREDARPVVPAWRRIDDPLGQHRPSAHAGRSMRVLAVAPAER